MASVYMRVWVAFWGEGRGGGVLVPYPSPRGVQNEKNGTEVCEIFSRAPLVVVMFSSEHTAASPVQHGLPLNK